MHQKKGPDEYYRWCKFQHYSIRHFRKIGSLCLIFQMFYPNIFFLHKSRYQSNETHCTLHQSKALIKTRLLRGNWAPWEFVCSDFFKDSKIRKKNRHFPMGPDAMGLDMVSGIRLNFRYMPDFNMMRIAGMIQLMYLWSVSLYIYTSHKIAIFCKNTNIFV